MGHEERIAGYEVLSVLGYGANSTIYAVQDPRNGQKYALKRVIKESSADQKFVVQATNEYELLSKIDHPSVRKCYRVKRLRRILGPSEVLLVMEIVEGRNLVQHRPSELSELVHVLVEVADGMHAVHKAGVVHADMKPNNVLITNAGHVKIIDFGQSCPTGTIKPRIQGTPDYIAPEQVRRRALTARTDIFNLGATMYWCVTDNHVPTLIPKNGGNEIGLKDEIQLKPPHEIDESIPLSLSNLIMNCLRNRPEERPESMAEVKARLEVVYHQLERGKAKGTPTAVSRETESEAEANS